MSGLAKGVDYYGYRSTTNYSVNFQYPTDDGNKTTSVNLPDTDDIWTKNMQMSTSDIAWDDTTGRFQWTAYDLHNGTQQLLSCYANINPYTGSMSSNNQLSGNLADMFDTPTYFTDAATVCYGFYDASTGITGLTSQDQCYVYVTGNYSNWMHDELGPTPSTHFNRCVLAGAHDAGMYDNSVIAGICHNTTLLAELVAALSNYISPATTLLSALVGMTAYQAQRALTAFACTQKEPVTNLLKLGVRYFDFRPGYCVDVMRPFYPDLYHQHKVIPGARYDDFLVDVLTWLRDNPTEIVVVALSNAGFLMSDMTPSTDTLTDYLTTAQQTAGTNFQIGNADNLSDDYSDLINNNCRLFLLNQFTEFKNNTAAADYYPATKYDSYHDTSYGKTAYQTTDVSTIIAALNEMDPTQQSSYNYTVLQLQGTCTATLAGTTGSVAVTSNAGSPLLSTKPSFDRSTYQWVAANGSQFVANRLLVLLNDFADNALVRRGTLLTRTRMGS